MASHRFSRRAKQDLREIWRTIAVDSESAADSLILRIFDKLELAAGQPLMGVARPELSPTARVLIEGRYIVIYEPTPFGLLVVAVVHGRRDPGDWL